MLIWYKTSVKFVKELPDGTLKRVTDQHLVRAESYSDAEARMYEEVGEFVRGEFIVTAIARMEITDVFEYEDSKTWWQVKVSYDVDDDNGVSKPVVNSCMVSAPDAFKAIQRAHDSFKETITHFTIPEMKLTKIVEIHAPIDAAERERRKDAKLAEDKKIDAAAKVTN